MSAPLGRYNDGIWVGLTQPDACRRQGADAERPGHMNLVTRDVLQFRQPQVDEMAFWIVIGRLFDHVKLAILPRIIADSSHVVPVAVVAADVVIEKKRLEPFGAQAPIQLQILDQKGGHILMVQQSIIIRLCRRNNWQSNAHLPPSIRHPTRLQQLPHIGIHKRHASFSH